MHHEINKSEESEDEWSSKTVNGRIDTTCAYDYACLFKAETVFFPKMKTYKMRPQRGLCINNMSTEAEYQHFYHYHSKKHQSFKQPKS